MQLLNVSMLWFLLLIPLVLLLRHFKPKPSRVKITTLFLIEQHSPEHSPHFMFTWLIKNRSLIVQIFVILLLSLALAQPVMKQTIAAKGDIVLIIDASASMKTVRDHKKKQSRFDEAVRIARQLISEKKSHQQFCIIEATTYPRVVNTFTHHKQQLLQSIRSLRPTDAGADISKAIQLALSLKPNQKRVQIYLISDPPGIHSAAVNGLPPSVLPVPIRGGGKRNVGITAFSFRQKPDMQQTFEIFLTMENFTHTHESTAVQIFMDNTLLFTDTLFFDALEQKVIIFPHHGLYDRTLHAHLTVEDDFGVDNDAYAVIASPQTMRISLISPGNFFLEHLLRSVPTFDVTIHRTVDPAQWPRLADSSDMTIIDRVAVPYLPSGYYILIDTYPPNIPIQKNAETVNPVITDWDNQHPVLRSVSFENVSIETASSVTASAAVQKLVDSQGKGLLYHIRNPKINAFFFSFNFLRSDIVLRVAFPVLINNIITYCNPYTAPTAHNQIVAGTPFPIVSKGQHDSITVYLPDSTVYHVRGAAETIPFHHTLIKGIYTLYNNSLYRKWAVNMGDVQESAITAGQFDHEPASTTVGTSVPQNRNDFTPLWPFLVVIAGMALVLEWYVWARRGG